MSGYLEGYGAGDAQRARLIKRLVAGGVGCLIVALALFFLLRNFREKRAVGDFLGLLRAQNYKAAYALWGCTDTNPCGNYSFEKFLEDWGPKSPHADPTATNIAAAESCGDGVVVSVVAPGAERVGLWVDPKTKVIGFAPWPQCPGRHWHIWEFLKSKFGKSST